MLSLGINEEGKLRGQPANQGLPGKMAVKTRVCVCGSSSMCEWTTCSEPLRENGMAIKSKS